jgi:hypothetical protein
MRQDMAFEPIAGLDRAAQLEWIQSLRSRTAHIELLFHDGDADHLLTSTLAWLDSSRCVRVGARPGYGRPQPSAVLHRYPYDRSILQALDDSGGIFEYVSASSGDVVRFTGLGNVDVTFCDRLGSVLGSTVTREGLILMPRGRGLGTRSWPASGHRT